MSIGKSSKVKGGCTLWARQTIDSEIFADKPAMWFKIWFYLVNKANHKDNEKFKRGQAYVKYDWIMTATGAKYNQVKHCIEYLKARKMITAEKATRGMFITIATYETYQNLENYKRKTEATHKGRQKEDKSHTINKNDKNGKNVKKNSPLEIFDFWNKYKGQSVVKSGEKISWHSHRLAEGGKVPPTIITAVRQNIPPYTVKDICQAIDNYAKVLLNKDYFWTHVWPLPTFLTVKYERNKQADRKWWQFLPDNFIEANFLTPTAKTRRKNEIGGPSIYEITKARGQKGKSTDESKQTA